MVLHAGRMSQPALAQGGAVGAIPGRLRELLGARLEREIYLSTEEAAQLTGRPSREAFIKWARRHHIPLRKPSPNARTLAVKKSDLDWALRDDRQEIS
jgi:hypothetical protein